MERFRSLDILHHGGTVEFAPETYCSHSLEDLRSTQLSMCLDIKPRNTEFGGLKEGQSSKLEVRAIGKPALGGCNAAGYSNELTNLRGDPIRSPNVASEESDEKIPYNLSVDSAEVKSLQVLCCSSLRRLHVAETPQDSVTHESAYLPPHSPSILLTSAVKSKVLQDIPPHLDQSLLGRKEEEGQCVAAITDVTEVECPKVFENPVTTQVEDPNSLQPPCNESASVLSVPDSDNMVVDHDESSSDILDDDDGLLGSRLRAHPSEESDSPSEDDSLYSEISHKSTSQYTDAVDIGIGTSDSRAPPATKAVGSRNLSPELTQANEQEAGDTGDVDERLDADQDKANPAYIPRTGTYFMHDYRSSENSKTSPQADSHKSRADRSKWQHDMFRYYEQGPRSSRELIMRYGYDIREGNADSNAPENEPHSPSVSAEHPINREALTTKPTSSPIHDDTAPHNINSDERGQSHISHGRPRRQNFADYQRETKRMDPNVGHTRGRFTRSLGIRHQFEQNEIPNTVSQPNEMSSNQFPKSRLQDGTGYHRESGNRGRRASRNANFGNASSAVSDSTMEYPTIRNDDPCASDDRSNKVVPNLSYSSSPGKAPHVGPKSRGGWTPAFSHRDDNTRVGTASKRYSTFRQATSTTTSVDASELTSRQTFTDPGLGTRTVACNFGDHKFSELSRSHTGNSSIPAVPKNPDLYSQTRPLQCPDIQHPNCTRLVQEPSSHRVRNSRPPFRPFTTGKDHHAPQASAAALRESYPADHLEFGSTEFSTYRSHQQNYSGVHDRETRSTAPATNRVTQRRPLLGRQPFKPLEILDPGDQLTPVAENARVENKRDPGTGSWFVTPKPVSSSQALD